MTKDLFTALKSLAALAQTAEPDNAVKAVCAELAGFIPGDAAVIDVRAKVLAQAGARPAFKLKEGVDGQYIDSRISDRLRSIDELTTLSDLTDPHFQNTTDDGYCAVILPLYAGEERIATLVARSAAPLVRTDMELLTATRAVVALIVRQNHSLEVSGRQRDTDAVKLAVGTLSYSELAAVLHVFRELEGGEGVLVASRIADKLGITRSIVVNALRKLEGAGVIETRSLGMKGTYIKVLNEMLLEELYKIRR